MRTPDAVRPLGMCIVLPLLLESVGAWVAGPAVQTPGWSSARSPSMMARVSGDVRCVALDRRRDGESDADDVSDTSGC
jgi:hypothetical protein